MNRNSLQIQGHTSLLMKNATLVHLYAVTTVSGTVSVQLSTGAAGALVKHSRVNHRLVSNADMRSSQVKHTEQTAFENVRSNRIAQITLSSEGN